MEKLKVVELFAGVGGFRLGLENTELNRFEVTWANQWEPGKKVQHAFDCYASRFETGKHINEDIAEVTDREMAETNADLIVGGFPCQDYSVARSLNGELGISGKKGVLFWEITRFIQNTIPKYVLLENVDRLLKSPSKQGGGTLLSCFRPSMSWVMMLNGGSSMQQSTVMLKGGGESSSSPIAAI